MRRNIILAIIPAPAGQYCGRCRCARRSAADYHQQCQRHAAGQYSNAQHYLVVAIGIILGVGDAAGKAIKAAEAALKKGDVTEASKLINKASGEISAQNSANYSKLKDDLRQQNLNNIAKQDPRLEIALKGDGSGKVDFGMGAGSRAEADRLGMIWLGDGAKQTSDGGWISADGTRGYRPPSAKDSSFATTGTQANFETYEITSSGKAVKVGNGHLNISD